MIAMRDIKVRMRSWPKVTSLILSLIPLCLMAFIVISIVHHSIPAMNEVGLGELFSTQYSSVFTTGENIYGLIPAIWGTVLVVLIAILIALPVSLAMAVFSSELSPGFAGGIMRGILGILSGIPPIVYALGAVVFVEVIMIPKFCGGFTFHTLNPAELGISPEDWPPPGLPWSAGALPWSKVGGNSTLLGGFMFALLTIPFMAPLIDDAIRNVPADLKEASSALGASRWHTLKKVVLPLSLPGIISAIALGALKAIGDVMIACYVIAWESGMPNPLWDVLQRIAPLTSTGAGLLGGFGSGATCSGVECSVGYFTALILLIMAFIIIGVTTFLQRRFKRSFSS